MSESGKDQLSGWIVLLVGATSLFGGFYGIATMPDPQTIGHMGLGLGTVLFGIGLHDVIGKYAVGAYSALYGVFFLSVTAAKLTHPIVQPYSATLTAGIAVVAFMLAARLIRKEAQVHQRRPA